MWELVYIGMVIFLIYEVVMEHRGTHPGVINQ